MSSMPSGYLHWRVPNELDTLEGPDDIDEDININIDI